MTQRVVCPVVCPARSLRALQPSSTDAQVLQLPIRPGRWREECVCPLSVQLPGRQEAPVFWECRDKGRLTTEHTQFISVNTVAVRPSTQPFTFLLNHTGKLETSLLAWVS